MLNTPSLSLSPSSPSLQSIPCVKFYMFLIYTSTILQAPDLSFHKMKGVYIVISHTMLLCVHIEQKSSHSICCLIIWWTFGINQIRRQHFSQCSYFIRRQETFIWVSLCVQSSTLFVKLHTVPGMIFKILLRLWNVDTTDRNMCMVLPE